MDASLISSSSWVVGHWDLLLIRWSWLDLGPQGCADPPWSGCSLGFGPGQDGELFMAFAQWSAWASLQGSTQRKSTIRKNHGTFNVLEHVVF